ncbi:helix-turn-helix transcriptional regulator [Salsuginibacillus kocurii]|uniref:helix-turn-helix transcriptional regulator n=1 Tax=Salsuginibacillus kocurii TaxID=427078 RepID=UPI000363A432|nr:helix-turn-helix transcriptional regulator [Salsuginibacillus kocurii]
MELGSQLKRLREEYNMSQEELSKKLGVSRQAVYKWESNKGYPDIENLIELSEIFNVTIDEIIKKDDKLIKKINVDEEKSTFSDAGFYVGLVIMFFGIFTNFGSVSTIFMFIGIAIIALYKDILNVLKDFIKDLKRTVKD